MTSILIRQIGDNTSEKQNMLECAKALCFKQIDNITQGQFSDCLNHAKQDHWVIVLLKIILTPMSLLFSLLQEDKRPTPSLKEVVPHDWINDHNKDNPSEDSPSPTPATR